MRTLTVAAMISLDGVLQAPGGPNEDTSGGFAHGGWIWPYADGSGQVMGGALAQPFELLLGRRTYDIFAGYWPLVPEGAPHQGIADLFNNTTKHVATHRPETLAWRNTCALGQNILASLRELKQTEGVDLITQGSSNLVHQLLATDLVDHLHLLIYPIVLGRGKRLFADDSLASAFQLMESRASATGVLIARYNRIGPVRSESNG